MTEQDWSYRPALDGLRTVAIYLVLLFHVGRAHLANGYIGVDVFFVLSGFLVTSIILREHAATGTLRLRRFYARRVRRLLPASVVLVVATCVLTVLVLPKLQRFSLLGDARAALLYVANWHFLGAATDYFANDVQRSPFLHFWSLAVEEQFYFVYPLLLLGLLKFIRSKVALGLTALLLASLALQWWLARTNPLRAYYGTDTRLYQLLAGAVLASARHRLRAISPRVGGAVAAVGVVALGGLATDAVAMSVAARGALAALLTVSVVAALEMAPQSTAHRVLATGSMTYLGRISYGTYLWHWPIIVLTGAVRTLPNWQMTLVAGLGATLLSAASFRAVETPIRRSKRLDPTPRSVVAIGLCISVVCAVVLVPPVLHSDRRPVLGRPATTVLVNAAATDVDVAALEAALSVVPPTSFDMAVTEPPKFDQVACSASSLERCVLHRGSAGAMRLHLIGDSNAMVLVPVLQQLAEQYDFTFTATAAVGCPWQLGLEWQAKDRRLVDICVAARQRWYDDVIPALQPDVILAVHVPRDPGSRKDAFFLPSEAAVPAATSDSLDRFRALGARTVVVEPLPYGDLDPASCLSGAAVVRDCSYQANAQPFPTEQLFRHLDAERNDVWAVDADRLACPFVSVCVPLIDGELVFRNQFHLSNQWVMHHADEWWALLVQSGAFQGWYEAAPNLAP